MSVEIFLIILLMTCGMIQESCYSPMAIKCYLMQFCVPRALPCVGLPLHFAEEEVLPQWRLADALKP